MIIVLTGPTGSGKTELAINLAKKINAEIINADAFQVYDELSIATAKPNIDQLNEIKHHLIGFVPLTKNYDVFQYQKDARKSIEEIQNLGKNIIFAGGTGLYIKAALFDYRFSNENTVDVSKFESLSNDELYKALDFVDHSSALTIHKNNRQRVLRALKYFYATGHQKSENMGDLRNNLLYDAYFFEIDYPREELYPLVEKRVDQMFDKGIEEENLKLIKKYGRTPRAFNAIGVKEFYPYIDGEISIDEVKENIKKATRHYIKRQETFFRHQFEVKKIKNIDEILKVIYE